MPGFDRTGPSGQEPMTGRQLGRCNQRVPLTPQRNIEGSLDSQRGLGLRRGLGRGFGRRLGRRGL